MAISPNNNPGPVQMATRAGNSTALIVGSQEIKSGWIVGIALDGDDKGKMVPVPAPAAEATEPSVRVLGQACDDYQPGDMGKAHRGIARLPLAMEELATDPSLYIGVKAKAWDHATVTVAGETVGMPDAGVIIELDGQDYVWIDLATANA